MAVIMNTLYRALRSYLMPSVKFIHLEREFTIFNAGVWWDTKINTGTIPILFSFFICISFPAIADVTGQARVVDGDTLVIADIRIRLHGIDSPEQKQVCLLHGNPWLCGEAATKALKTMIGAQSVSCRGDKKDRYKRLIAVCFVDQRNLNSAMVFHGWALAYRKYSLNYVSEEVKASQNKRGIWEAVVDPPWEWRRIQRAKK